MYRGPMKRSFPGSACVAFVLLALVSCGGAPPPVAPTEVTIAAPAPEKALSEEAPGPDAGPVPVTAADPTSGAADAPVTLVQIGDFGSPFCAQMAPWIRDLRRSYPLDRLRIVYKSVPDPDRPESLAAATAGLAVLANGGPKAFWTFYDQTFAAFPDLAPAQVDQWASRAGVAEGALHRTQTSPSVERAIAANLALAKQLDLAAPQILVNGVWVLSLSSPDAIRATIETELRIAEQLITTGTPRGKVYAERTAMNLATKAGRPSTDANSVPQPGGVLFGAKHILVMYQGSRRAASSVTRTKAEALARAQQVLKQARSGMGFDVLVGLYSDEPGAARRGGDLGTFRKGQMVAGFQDAVEVTPIGKLSDVVETEFGFHIILRTQ